MRFYLILTFLRSISSVSLAQETGDPYCLVYCEDSLVIGFAYPTDTIHDSAGYLPKIHFSDLFTQPFSVKFDLLLIDHAEAARNLAGTSYLVCLSKTEADSVMHHFKTLRYALPYYGDGGYSAKRTELMRTDYGIEPWHIGCVVDDSFKEYNQAVRRILDLRNGKGWEERLRTHLQNE